MMDVYCVNGMDIECIELFKNMNIINDMLIPDVITYAIVLKACTNSICFEFGEQIYNELMQHKDYELLLKRKEIQMNLILMYGKYGKLDIVKEIFMDIKKNEYDKFCTEIDIWNAMINVYGMNGDLKIVQNMLNKMKDLGMNLNEKIFTTLICVYGHIGDVVNAENVWNNEIKDVNIKYNRYVVTSMVDCLGRCGKLKYGKEIILEYEKYSNNEYHESMWSSLLSACYKYGNKENKLLAEDIYNDMIQRFSHNKSRMKSASVIMSNIRRL
eukprot:528594_1